MSVKAADGVNGTITFEGIETPMQLQDLREGFEYTGDIRLGAPERKAITVDPKGNIIGDTADLPADILEQMQSPESQARIRKMYEDYHGKKYDRTPLPGAKFIVTGQTLRHGLQPGETRADLRKKKRKFEKKFRRWSQNRIEEERGKIK